MKKILISLVLVVAVATVASVATYAVWNATANIDGNTIGAAQLSITATAAGKSSPVADPLPFSAEGLVPGSVTTPELRAVISNDSDVPLNLYMYVEGIGGAACSATKIAWQSSRPGNGVLNGYSATPFPPVLNPGQIDGTDSSLNFTNIYSASNVTNLWGIDNKVLIADSADFENGDKVALRQIVGFATDADNSYQGTSCEWTLKFVAETVTPAP
jgi:hypothetical protein